MAFAQLLQVEFPTSLQADQEEEGSHQPAVDPGAQVQAQLAAPQSEAQPADIVRVPGASQPAAAVWPVVAAGRSRSRRCISGASAMFRHAIAVPVLPVAAARPAGAVPEGS
ncbi:hypothetical protein AQJ11_34575 [Streptomyces corchorusii]|uniref:Uncharacterized protein n=1 Tax=Streptomyces corchorusii TaxID=1903 RepID=A0A101PVQ8_STRCK|nr:hypothetical protein AQJ11_34575 [Streptomyces corchorusii]